MKWKAALLHALHDRIFANTGGTGNDDEKRIGFTEFE
jgi:hypothetical protein